MWLVPCVTKGSFECRAVETSSYASQYFKAMAVHRSQTHTNVLVTT